MFSQRKTVELLNGSNLNGWNSDLIGRNLELIGRNSDLIERNVVKVLMPEKKSAWTDLDRVGFEKIFQSVNVQIEKLAWTGLGKVKRKASSAASVFKFLQDWSPGGRRMRSALRWPALDKRCSSCYTLRGCGFADIQSREEFTDALAS